MNFCLISYNLLKSFYLDEQQNPISRTKHICHEFAFKCNIRIDYVQTLSFDMTFWVKVYVAEQSKNNKEGF